MRHTYKLHSCLFLYEPLLCLFPAPFLLAAFFPNNKVVKFSTLVNMQSVFKGTMQKASEAIDGAMSSNKKLADMKPETREPSKTIPLTTDTGVREPTHDEWLSATTGDRQGPMLLEDNYAREKIMKFDHERIPERVVHARGTGAFGNFKLYESAAVSIPAGKK